MQKTTLEAMYQKPKKGVAASAIPNGTLLQDCGLAGDVFAVGGARQISILYAETHAKMETIQAAAPCLRRFGCTLLLSGEKPDTLRVGSRLQLGDAELTVTQIGRSCHGLCTLGSCPLCTEAIFAAVTCGGEIAVGTEVRYA